MPTGPRIVVDDRGVAKTIAGKLAIGGEGAIVTLADRPDLVAKIYHPAILADHSRASRLESKVREMSQHQDLRNHPQLAWPLVPLRFPGAGWCGYAMRRKSGLNLRLLLGSPSLLAGQCPSWHRQHLARLCLDLLDTFEHLAARRVLPVDFNPSNWLVDTDEIRVSFIDCDAFQVVGPSGTHRCESITPEMAAPEVALRQSLSLVSAQSIRFSVAMLLFHILTLGNSPFRHRHGDDPVQNLIRGSCALGKGASHQLPTGSYYRIWSHLIFDLKQLFLRCFRDGHSDPAARPSLCEWRQALLKYNHCLVIGHSDASLIPGAVKPSNYNPPTQPSHATPQQTPRNQHTHRQSDQPGLPHLCRQPPAALSRDPAARLLKQHGGSADCRTQPGAPEFLRRSS